MYTQNMGITKQQTILQILKQEVASSQYFSDANWPNDDEIENFIWIGTKNGLIGNDNCHYEFIFQEEQSDELTLEVHFEGENQSQFANLDLPSSLKHDKWQAEDCRIIFADEHSYNVHDEEIVEKSMKDLKQLHKMIGSRLEEIARQDKPKLSGEGKGIITHKCYSVRAQQETKHLETIHGSLQEELEAYLKRRKEYSKIIPEAGFENRNYSIDMLARRKKDGYYDVFEVKSYSTAAECIREALGQILFYKYLLTESGCDIGTLFIVGQNEMSSL